MMKSAKKGKESFFIVTNSGPKRTEQLLSHVCIIHTLCQIYLHRDTNKYYL